MNYGIIGHLRPRELEALTAEFRQFDFPQVTSDGFDPWMETDQNKKDALRYGIPTPRYRTILKRNNYVKFLNEHLPCGLRSFHSRYVRDMYDEFCCQGFYAAMHQDAHIEADTQIMMVVRNSGHRLYSTDFKIVAPKAGDIVRLNTHHTHALFPCETMTPYQCERNPLEFYAVSFAAKA